MRKRPMSVQQMFWNYHLNEGIIFKIRADVQMLVIQLLIFEENTIRIIKCWRFGLRRAEHFRKIHFFDLKYQVNDQYFVLDLNQLGCCFYSITFHIISFDNYSIQIWQEEQCDPSYIFLHLFLHISNLSFKR